MSIGKAKNERDYEYVETAKLHANVEKLEATPVRRFFKSPRKIHAS